jgi:hypothetical protein
MRIYSEYHYLVFEITKNSFFTIRNEWRQLFGKSNWYNFTLIEISAENDDVCPGFEFDFIVLGLGIHFRHNRSWEGTEIQERLDALNEKEDK